MNDIENVEVINQGLIASLSQANEGGLNKFASANSDFIRRRIREKGFLRSIIPAKPLTNEGLDRTTEGSSLPIRIEDMEPNSPGAVSLPFQATSDSTFYSEDRFQINFEYIQTREFVKNINELRTQRMDIRAVVTDNALKDVHTKEDALFINLCDEIVGAAGSPAPFSGLQQHFTFPEGLTRETAVEMLKLLPNNYLNNGVVLMNRNTGMEYLKYNRIDAGGDLSQDMFLEGMDAFKEARILGTRHIFTLKREIVPDNTIYIFTEPGYLGRFYELMPLTMYVEKKEDIIRFKAKELIGLTIANVLGVVKIQLNVPNGG